ncbi:MAG TPA: L,D-transpeptidase [Thermoanaerobaculia bacterium]|nr:L,D-transpeptidase [Thermoanaerobaculia bacterium]
MVTSDRRSEHRPQSPSRRSFRRPALWLNLLVLLLGLAALLGARQHRLRLDTKFERIVQTQVSSPFQIARIRNDVASMDLTRESLDRELRERLAMARSFEAAEFYLAIDTENRRMSLHFGPEIVREAGVVIGEPRVITAQGKTWRFVPLKGALTVIGKLADQPWAVPAWVFAMRNAPIPQVTPNVPGGLGKYVILLPNGYVIHSPPARQSPLSGAKPGSFMIAEEEMRAIWPRISATTRVYIY